jgi:hypothetical protein
MTLEECENLHLRLAALHEGSATVAVKVTFAQDSNKETFFTEAKEVLSDPGSVIGINYHPSSLIGSEFAGHFSPLAAYDEQSNRFLVMDVWPETPEMWVEGNDLWSTIDTKDWDSKLSRGWVTLTKEK